MRKKLSDFFSMSKSERMGAYVVLMIMGMVIMGAIVKGLYDKEQNYASQEFKEKIEKLDSLEKSIKESKVDTLKTSNKKKKTKKNKRLASKGVYKDRSLDEVPQY